MFLLLYMPKLQTQISDLDSWFTIHNAAFNGKYDILLEELNNGVSVNSIMYDLKFQYKQLLYPTGFIWLNNVTSIYLAALNGHSRCVKLLMARGADPTIQIVNTFSKKSYNAFDIALWKFNFNCYRLMKKKNNIKIVLSSSDSNVAYRQQKSDQTLDKTLDQILLD